MDRLMGYDKVQTALNQYASVSVDATVAYADPHQLVQMLFAHALERISMARGCLQGGRTAEKAAHLSKAVSIVEGLRMALDLKQGGDIARNLEELYDYMARRLLQANAGNDAAALDEVQALLAEIKAAWDAIAAHPAARAGAPGGR